ncbi:CHAT domain-containing protein [Mycena epipterygia]|nr:CHAT domain-containing protein [Mycena epipterygia]
MGKRLAMVEWRSRQYGAESYTATTPLSVHGRRYCLMILSKLHTEWRFEQSAESTSSTVGVDSTDPVNLPTSVAEMVDIEDIREDQVCTILWRMWNRGLGHGFPVVSQYRLAACLVDRYQRSAELRDINAAIKLAQGAAEHTTGDQHVKSLLILAAALRNRFHRLSNSSDIENAQKCAQEAYRLTTEGSGERGNSLHMLGWIYRTKYEVQQEFSDLQLAIQHYGEALKFVPDLELLRCLQGLSVSLGDRSQRLRTSSPSSSLLDAERALFYCRRLIQIAPIDRLERPTYLQSLASAFYDQYMHTRQLDTLEKAILNTQHALRLMANQQHPHRPSSLQNLALYLTTRCSAVGSTAEKDQDITAALLHYRDSFTGVTSQPMRSFDAACRWAKLAYLHKPDDCLTAYSTAFSLLPEILWVGNSLEVHRMACQRIKITETTSDALRACIEHSNIKRAIEFAELGLATALQQRLQLKVKPHEPLLPSEDAEELKRISFLLYNRDTSVEDRLQASTDRTRLLTDIRKKPGLESFLLPREYAHLRHASKNGPVIILNSHESHCDAIILLRPTQDPLHLKLPGVSSKELGEQKGKLDELLRSTKAREPFRKRIMGRLAQLWEHIVARLYQSCRKIFKHSWKAGDNEYRNFTREGPTAAEEFEEVLEWLWGNVVAPVYKELNANGIMDGRLWWCPTGSFIELPFHAAVYSSASSSSQSSQFIQSYTLTLGALADHHEPQHAGFPTVGLVGIPETGPNGENKLPNVMKEMEEIRTIVGLNHIRECEGKPTVGNVEKLLSDCPWLHLACHGDPNIEDPRKSRLMLYRSSLDLDAIARIQNPNAQFVFLAACKTAVGDSKLVNEALHITGGFIAAGFKGAIGTLWSMCDDDGPFVARTVYRHLFRNGQAPKVTDTARALDLTVKVLRHKVPYHRWVPFVHIGV